MTYLLSIIIVCIALAYTCLLTTATAVGESKYYYFLTSKTHAIEVGAEFARLEGGAGYLCEVNGKEYVALSVYETLEDGQVVQANLKKQGKETEILTIGGQTLYFKGRQKNHAKLYEGGLRLLEKYISFLSECISRLEKGTTQQTCKRLLSVLQRQYEYTGEEYAAYKAFSKLCKQSAEKLATINKNTVYLKDLRYLLCWQVENYGKLCGEFSL